MHYTFTFLLATILGSSVCCAAHVTAAGSEDGTKSTRPVTDRLVCERSGHRDLLIESSDLLDALDLCRHLFGPLAENDTEVWLSRMLDRVDIDATLVNRTEIPADERISFLRAAMEQAGDPRALLGLSPREPIRVIVDADCRSCIRAYVRFRVVGSPDIIVDAVGSQEPLIVAISAASSGFGASIEYLTLRAWLVVRGRFESSYARGGAVVGNIDVLEVLKGSAETKGPLSVQVSGEMSTFEGRSGIFFLVPRHIPSDSHTSVDRWFALRTEESVTFGEGTAGTVGLHAKRDEPFERRATREFGIELALLRNAGQHRYTPDSRPAVEAARRVFSSLDFVGADREEIERLLGGPAETGTVDGESYRIYGWHDGETGVFRRLMFSGSRVDRVIEIPTQ